MLVDIFDVEFYFYRTKQFSECNPKRFFGIKVDFRVTSKYLTTARRERAINGKQRGTFIQRSGVTCGRDLANSL